MFVPLPRVAVNTDPEIIKLCKQIAPETKPFYLATENIPGMLPNDCYKNVERTIHKYGGKMQLGWQIWETLPKIFAEAEFHAVWVDPQGAFHDITPKSLPHIFGILFLPDETRVYQDKQIDNIRISLIEDPLIDAYIEAEKFYFEVVNRGDLATFYGDLSTVMTPEIKGALLKREDLKRQINEKYFS